MKITGTNRTVAVLVALLSPIALGIAPATLRDRAGRRRRADGAGGRVDQGAPSGTRRLLIRFFVLKGRANAMPHR